MTSIAKKIAGVLARNSLRTFNEDQLRFGLELVLGAWLQLIIIITTAMLLGLTKEVAFALLSAAIYRKFTGGAHCNAFYRCTITSIITFLLLGVLARIIELSNIAPYIACTGVLSIALIICRVPVDNPRHRITDLGQKARMKSYSLAILAILLTAITICEYVLHEKTVAVAIMLGLLWQNFTLLSWGHAFINACDRLFNQAEKFFKERREIHVSKN